MTRAHHYVGRIGGLALALGVGGAIAALPVAAADTGTGNSGKTSSSADSSGKPGPTARGAKSGQAGQTTRTSASAVAGSVSTAHSLRTSHRVSLDSLGGSRDPLGPIATPLELAALAARRELNPGRVVAPAATVTTGAPAGAASTDTATWNSQVAPTLTNFIKNDIGFAGMSSQQQAVVNAVLPSVVSLMGAVYTGTPINGVLTNLANNQTVLGIVTNGVETGLIANGLTSGAAHVAGQAVGYLAQSLLGNAKVQNAVNTLAQTLTVVPNGWDVDTLLDHLNSPTYTLTEFIQDDVEQSAPAFVTGLPVLLADHGLRTAVFGTIKGALHVLVGLSGWQEDPSSAFVHFIGDQIELAAGDGTDTTPATAAVLLAGRAAVEHILSSAVIVDGALGALETTVSTLLDYPGVDAAVVTAADSVAQALADGTDDAQSAVDAAMEALRADTHVQSAIGAALKAGLKSAAGNTAILNDIDATVRAFIIDVASADAIQGAVIDRFGAKYGGEIVGVLTNAPAMAKIAAAIGTAVPKFLEPRGVVEVLGEAVNQAVLATFDSQNPDEALQTVFTALRTNSTIQAALKSTVSAVVRGVLGVRALEQAVDRITGYAIQDFFDSAPFNNPTLERLAANALKSVVSSLMGDGSVRNLIGNLAGDFVSGRPAEDVVRSLINGVLSSPGLQFAVGIAIGDAVGSVFGGGPIGFLVSRFVGIPSGLFIAVNALPVLLFVRSGLADFLIAQFLGSLPVPEGATVAN